MTNFEKKGKHEKFNDFPTVYRHCNMLKVNFFLIIVYGFFNILIGPKYFMQLNKINNKMTLIF